MGTRSIPSFLIILRTETAILVPFCPDLSSRILQAKIQASFLVAHIVGNVEQGKMNYWCNYYRDVMGFERYITFDDKDISTEYSALMSIVMSDGEHNIKFPINEPAEGKGGKSQIQEYIDYYKSAGVQHIALLCKDILHTVSSLKENGIDFLEIPGYLLRRTAKSSWRY